MIAGMLCVQISEALIQIDIVNCRAKHAEWLSGTRPVFRDRYNNQGSITISGAAPTSSREDCKVQNFFYPTPLHAYDLEEASGCSSAL